jgi:LuxR family maltose regulon positive regulatory protein
MALPLLTTKLYIPPGRADIVSRPHLIRVLQEGLNRPGNFGLISSPAGFGKTTLLSEFANERVGKIAWISLDEGDNDPSQFWMYLVAACQTVLPVIAESTAIIFHSPQPLPGEAIATTVINAIASVKSDLTLVLDDYHVIQMCDI